MRIMRSDHNLSKRGEEREEGEESNGMRREYDTGN